MSAHFLNYPSEREALLARDGLATLAKQGNTFMRCNEYDYFVGVPVFHGDPPEDAHAWRGLYRARKEAAR